MEKPTILNVIFENFEVIEERVVDEKLGEKELDVKVKWGQASPYIGGNGRAYRPELLEREIKKINERIAKGNTVWGASYHPTDGLGKTGDISHMWKKVWMEEDGTCKGTLTLLPTTEGKNVQVLVGKGRLGISSRGFGTVTEKEMTVDGVKVKYNDVNDDFKMVNPGDFVISPAIEGAGNIAEEISHLESKLNNGLDLSEKKGKDKMKDKISEQAVQLLIEKTFEISQREGATETFEEWKKDGGEATVRALCAVESGEYSTIEEALAKSGHAELADELDQSECFVEPKDVQEEALQAGVDPAKYAEMLNANLKEQQEARRTGWTQEKRDSILQEAQQSGVNVRTHEARMKVLNEHPVFVHKSKDERLEEEVIARHKALTESGENVSLEDVRKVMKRDREKQEEAKIRRGKFDLLVKENLIAGPKKVFK